MRKNNKLFILGEILSWKISINNEKRLHYKCQKLPKVFESIQDYKKKFEPLFLEEIYAQLTYLFKIENDLKIFGNACLFKTKITQNKFYIFIKIKNEQITNYKNGTLLIISVIPIKSKKITEINFIFGIIADIYLESKFLVVNIDNKNYLGEFSNKKEILILNFNKISPIFPYTKGYEVLDSLERIPIKIREIIFTGILKKEFHLYLNKYEITNIHFKKHFNKSQIEAIFAIFDKKITLIQGPPGTGKTRTIIGILSLLNTDFFTNCINLENILKTFFEKNNIYLFRNHNRIIICASSNAAVDENASRSLTGFPYQNIVKVFKAYNILRMGPNYHFSIDHVSLENLALSWASENDKNVKFWMNKIIIQKARFAVLEKSSIIYTTLACAGYSIFEKVKLFETIIIDEAAQAIEVDTLIPIRKSCQKLIMIGDVQQLPATIFCKTSIIFEYDRSLFKRLQLQKYPVWFLKTQYRMHPQISSFPARKFYKNGLKDSENVAYIKIKHSLRCFGPLNFFDIRDSLEKNHLKLNISWCNLDEVRVINLIFRSLICLYSSLNLNSFGIITGYKGQIRELQNYDINKRLDLKQQINTVDGFQGKEKDFIFFSAVRSKFERGIGFLSDCRRINVAFTRARAAFWIIGNSITLSKDLNWKEIIFDSQKRTRIFCFRKPLERSSRRSIYWSIQDDENYSFDGENNLPISIKLLLYVKKINNRK